MTNTKKAEATTVWRIMSEYSIAQFRQKSRGLNDIGLTPGHMKALMTLEPGEALPMGACAQEMGCDASTATWLIDRLEEKGLVERRPSTTDRRVKGVVLTELGSKTKATLKERYSQPPEALLEMSLEELQALSSLLSKLAAIEKTEKDRQPAGR
ncbi:MAG TPA: MarR family transcriptional regulator [Actinomycetota bacterium]|nr:MarR family transcriptional regulator [Actinomycetota bacterium]